MIFTLTHTFYCKKKPQYIFQLYKRHLLLRSFAHLGVIVFCFFWIFGVVELSIIGTLYRNRIQQEHEKKKNYTQQLSGVYIGKADASYILNEI